MAAYNEIITELAVENVEIDRKLATIESQLTNGGSTDPDYQAAMKAYDAKMEKFDEALTKYTNDYKEVQKDVVTNGSYVSYKNNSVYTQGGIRMLIAIPALLILGCFVGCVVNVCLDHKKLTKKEEKEVSTENN